MTKKYISFIAVLFFFYIINCTWTKTILVNTEKKLLAHRENMPKGNLQQIAYVKQLIDYMYNFDQEVRLSLLDSSSNLSDRDAFQVLHKIDGFHLSKIKEILKEHGWITISKFGPEYDHKAWLLIQHADQDPFFQAGVLFILSQLLHRGETDKKNYAYLFDRVSVKFNKLGLSQKYGTQAIIKENGHVEVQQPHESFTNIDKNRADIGLENLDTYITVLKKLYAT